MTGRGAPNKIPTFREKWESSLRTRRGDRPTRTENQLCRCTGTLPLLKTPHCLHRMLSYAIRVISAFLGDLMTNAPHFGNQRTVFHFRFPKVRFSRKVCGVMICGHLKPAFSTILIVLGNVCGFAM